MSSQKIYKQLLTSLSALSSKEIMIILLKFPNLGLALFLKISKATLSIGVGSLQALSKTSLARAAFTQVKSGVGTIIGKFK